MFAVMFSHSGYPEIISNKTREKTHIILSEPVLELSREGMSYHLLPDRITTLSVMCRQLTDYCNPGISTSHSWTRSSSTINGAFHIPEGLFQLCRQNSFHQNTSRLIALF